MTHPSTIHTKPSGASAWNQQELAANPHENAEKAGKVRSMFNAIAGSYDLNNRLHSFGRDQAWRKHAVRTAQIKPGDRVLDVACGTGDLTEWFARSAATEVIGLDFTRGMLDVAREKRASNLTHEQASKVSYVEGDAMNLPFEAQSFDALSIAFGIRNVASPAKALSEFQRVLRPGGRLIVLEFDRPAWFPMRQLNDFYCGWLMPRTASLIARDRSGAYRYLPKSVGSFLNRHQLQEAIQNAGFRDVKSRALTFGICICHRAERI
ncbi:MAG: bifunctional demethylmenaquinone methyltransferase/2-methoxy-6-polyprenyl-1,4-benzoquinol methylase UbiE [Phycisphaerae bacterium]|nr:bifunctional demethylmenaquinone methyltransferase/2-methoxy-6-polyprenyl-1,4-benzoquinol methylase UbiE [Phycisphaerae bacterium]MBN8598593.1 bifunctional demethylmenaquinone methyltransferase/2-methoxy-6-polyprenyl-1,4-benzoquinol methylase UbiE [Planctomycetota bacterium]